MLPFKVNKDVYNLPLANLAGPQSSNSDPSVSRASLAVTNRSVCSVNSSATRKLGVKSVKFYNQWNQYSELNQCYLVQVSLVPSLLARLPAYLAHVWSRDDQDLDLWRSLWWSADSATTTHWSPFFSIDCGAGQKCVGMWCDGLYLCDSHAMSSTHRRRV